MKYPSDQSEESSSRSSVAALAVGLLVVLVITGVGYIGKMSGTGWFGYRQILYGDGELYLLNLGPEALQATVDGRGPFEVASEGGRLVELIGGESEVVVQTPDGEPVTSYTVTADESDALVKMTEDGCAVAVDVSPYYSGEEPGDELKFETFIAGNKHVYVPGSRNVIWPRYNFPDQLAGDGGEAVWIETVGCPLLQEQDYLETYLLVRLRDRMNQTNSR